MTLGNESRMGLLREKPVVESNASRSSESFVNGLCENYEDAGMVREMCEGVFEKLGGVSPDLAIVFAAAPKHFKFKDILPSIHRYLAPSMVVGCSGSGVIGNGRELEQGAGLSILAVNCNKDRIRPFSFTDKQACDRDATPETMLDVVGVDSTECEGGSMLIFIDPLTVSTDYSLSMLDSAYPQVNKFGALVSGGLEYGDNGMFAGDEVKRQGAVGLLFAPDFQFDTIVSDSQTPIGSPMVITVSNRNVIHRLNDRAPMQVLEELHRNADSQRQRMISQTLVAGIESDRFSYSSTGMYDFVMRNIMGMDESTAAIAIGDLVEDGQAFQFHVRDPMRAERELRINLEDYLEKCRHENRFPDAALCFNSITRGTRMFDQRDHDAGIIREHIGDTPVAGFFSNGEISSRRGGLMLEGVVSKVMGYTNSLVMLSKDSARMRDRDSQGNAEDSRI